MYKDTTKRREASKERMRRMRQGVTGGVTKTKGVTALEGQGVTFPDIIDKLTDTFWRGRLEKICNAFKASSNPSYSKDVWLGVTEDITVEGGTNLSTVCDYLECTS